MYPVLFLGEKNMGLVRASVLYQDPFAPVLLSSEPLAVTLEQRLYIKEILNKACSDSLFSDKAYVAIVRVLTGGSVVLPTTSSLSPNSATLGDASFTMTVNGTGFTPTSVIVFNGYEEPTTFVSPTSVTTGINMDVWLAPAAVPVGVLSDDGILSNTQTFTFNDVAAGGFSTKTPTKPSVVPTPVTKTEKR